jgi:hypothetical protein
MELCRLAATNFARGRQHHRQTAAAVAELIESTCLSPGYQGATTSPPRLAAPTSSDRVPSILRLRNSRTTRPGPAHEATWITIPQQ